MNRSLRAALALLVASCPSLAPAQVEYRVRFRPDEPVWQVEARFPGRGEDALDFWIARWTAGAYHLADYGRAVRELTATDENGTALAVERDGPSHFVLRGAAAAKEVVMRYTAGSLSKATFGDRVIDVEANRIAADYAYINPVSLFGFVPARIDEPVALAVDAPPGWKTATVLERDQAGRWCAPSFYRFEDSPLLFSPTLVTAGFEVEGKPHAVTAHDRNEAEVAELAAGCKRIVAAAGRLMGGLPYDRYHFLLGFVNGAAGSGLEHSYSTLILVDEDTETDEQALGFWGVVAHEFFHLW